jgi:hypothetical protein
MAHTPIRIHNIIFQECQVQRGKKERKRESIKRRTDKEKLKLDSYKQKGEKIKTKTVGED